MTDWRPPPLDPETRLRDRLDADGWRPAFVEIARQQGLPSGDLHPFSSGSDVVFGGPGFAIKLSEPRWAADIAREAATIGHVGAQLPGRAPELIATGELGGWPWVVMTRQTGVALSSVWPTLDHTQRLRLSARIGEAMAALHSIKPPVDDTWSAFMAERQETLIERHRGRGVPEHWLARMPDLLARAERPAAERLVLVHTELLDEHLFVQRDRDAKDDWEVAGFIDFAESRVGHPDYDIPALVEFIFKGEAGLLGTCLSAYGWSTAELSTAGSRRICAWGLLHRYADLCRPLAAAGAPEPADFDDLCARVYDLQTEA